jgi:hypothetical protein
MQALPDFGFKHTPARSTKAHGLAPHVDTQLVYTCGGRREAWERDHHRQMMVPRRHLADQGCLSCEFSHRRHLQRTETMEG